MADEKLRELHRLSVSSGSVEERIALLAARLRVGDINKSRLNLAAFCGDLAAREIVGYYTHIEKGGEICCCGELDVDHGFESGHSPVHACEYYDKEGRCDCILDDREVTKMRIYPDKAPLDRWIARLKQFGVPTLLRSSIIAARPMLDFFCGRGCTRVVDSVLGYEEHQFSIEHTPRCRRRRHVVNLAAQFLDCACGKSSTCENGVEWELELRRGGVLGLWLPRPDVPHSRSILMCGEQFPIGEQTILKLLKSELTKWALRE